MTSNGNTAQKHLIKILTETHQEPKTAYKQAIATAPSKETAEAIKRIYKKLTEQKTTICAYCGEKATKTAHICENCKKEAERLNK